MCGVRCVMWDRDDSDRTDVPTCRQAADASRVRGADSRWQVVAMSYTCAPRTWGAADARLIASGAIPRHVLTAHLPTRPPTHHAHPTSQPPTGLFSDVSARRAALRSSHGFVCCCPRCLMEQEHFPSRRLPGLEAARAAARAATAAAVREAIAAATGARAAAGAGESAGAAGEGAAGEGKSTGVALAASAAAVSEAELSECALADVAKAEALMGHRNPGLLQVRGGGVNTSSN